MRLLLTGSHAKQNLYFESETGTGKTLATLCAILNFIKQWKYDYGKIKLIYASRTHLQLENVVSDFRLTSLKSDINILTLGSKSAMNYNNCQCLN